MLPHTVLPRSLLHRRESTVNAAARRTPSRLLLLRLSHWGTFSGGQLFAPHPHVTEENGGQK